MSKTSYGISSDIYNTLSKGEKLLEVSDVQEYLESPLKMFIILKGRVKVYFDRPGAKFTPIKIQSQTDHANFKIDRVSPMEFGELDCFGDFKQMLRENTFIKFMYFEGKVYKGWMLSKTVYTMYTQVWVELNVIN